MYTGKNKPDRENKEYHAQISVYHGTVRVDILSKTYSFATGTDLYLTIMDKTFGRMFRSQPRPKDYENAKRWMNDRMNDLEEHTTHLITRPEFLKHGR